MSLNPFRAIRLDKLKPGQVEKLILAMRAEIKPDPRAVDGIPGEPVRVLSDSRIRSTYTVLRAWNRVDLDAATLNVAATIGRIGGQFVISAPKTERSRRTVPLSPTVIELLRKHKADQAAKRPRAGNQCQDSGLIFTTDVGAPSTHATCCASSRPQPSPPA